MNHWRFPLPIMVLSLLGVFAAGAEESGTPPTSHGDMTHDHGMRHETGAEASPRIEPAMPGPAMADPVHEAHEGMTTEPVAVPGAAMPETDHAGHTSPAHGLTQPSAPAMEHGATHDQAPGTKHGSSSVTAETKNTSPSGAIPAGSATPVSAVSHDMATMQGGSAPPDARDPHAYSGGYDFGPIPRPQLADEHNFGLLLIDRLEYAESSDERFWAYDLQGWFGRDYDRLAIKAEGEVDEDELQAARTELLWGHAIAAYWDTQLGLRHDSGIDPERTWLALGVQGLAPYWFEVSATAYAGEEGRSALRLDAEYELLFTQRLILQPRMEVNLYGKPDEERGVGAGLSDVAAGLRLRYEIRRQIGPYVGVEWRGLYGETADFAEEADTPTDETRWIVGLRAWF
jgi:copper resistance protein B